MSEAGTAPRTQRRDLLLDRQREVDQLAALVRGLVAGDAGIALVEGPAGIGKSRLLAEVRQLARLSGGRVLSARGSELEQEFPFGVVCQLFEPALVDEEARARALRGAAAPARTVFSRPGEIDDDGYDPSFAHLHGLFWLTANLSAAHPLVLVADDLQWCDQPSLRFLAYLVRRLEGLAVLVVASVRRSDPGAEPVALGEIAGDPLAVTIPLHPLGHQATAELVRHRLGPAPDEAFATACHRATAGNPLLLHELLRALAAEGASPDAGSVGRVSDLGPAAVERVVLTHLSRLPEVAARIARAVAVLGAGTDLANAARLAGLDESLARHGAAALMSAEILRDDDVLTFVHPVVAAAVYDALPPPERQVQHRRAAQLLSGRGAADELVASHLLSVPPAGEGEVVDALRRAAAAALRRGAAEGAVAYLTRAWQEPPTAEQRPHVLGELGAAETLVDGPAALAHLEDAYDLQPDPVARAGIARRLGRALLLTGQEGKASALAGRAAAALPDDLGDVRRELEALELLALFLGGADVTALDRLASHRARPIGAGIGSKMLATVAARVWPYYGGSSRACTQIVLDVLADGELIEKENDLVAMSALTTLARADREEAVEAWQPSLAAARRRGSLAAKACIGWGLGVTMLRRGELAEAEDWARTASEEARGWLMGSEPEDRFTSALLAVILAERGEMAAARRALQRGEDPGDRSTGTRYWLYGQLELLVAEGRFAEAVAASTAFGRRFAHIHNPIDTPWHEQAALALDGLGRSTEALRLARTNVALARLWGAPGTVARALRTLGTVEHEDGLVHLREAVDAAAGSPARLEHAKALAALGRGLRHARRGREARVPLRQALDLADTCGAAGLVDQVRSELYAVGARPRVTAVAGVRALTPTELRVANLAAQGRTNRGIAQALYVTPKTVEVHLTNAYRKLGIRARHQLAAELGST